MNEFELDPELHETLKGVRESVRRLFEQLRLNNENGDVSGKARLERVPAFAKRNFGNLADCAPQLAIKQAWRIVDFLEGEAGARLSPLAREALRPVELDKQLATLRASQVWRDAAARLRDALGAARHDAHSGISSERGAAGIEQATEATSFGHGSKIQASPSSDVIAGGPWATSARSRTRRWSAAISVAIGIIGAIGVAIWLRNAAPDPRFACLPLESASSRELAAHWAVERGTPVPRPEPITGRSNALMVTISDPPAGGPVRSIFTTSQYSFEEGTRRRRPGGGKADFRLRVGGWGDTYLSLLKFPIPDNRLVRSAIIRLVVLGDEPTSRPTTMALRIIGDPWDVPQGPQHRLWWENCPQSEVVRTNLPAPGPPESVYDIEITDVYNLWARGLHPNHGIMLEPEHIGSYGANRDRYSNFSTFYSTRAIDPSNRPKLILVH